MTRLRCSGGLRFNAGEMMEETGKAPVRCYYCNSCAGWHVTSNPNQEYFIEKEYQASFNWKESQKCLVGSLCKLRSAYLRRNYLDCYKYIEEGYIEIEKAERAHVDFPEYEKFVKSLMQYANELNKRCPRYNIKLNLSIASLDKLIKKLRNAAHSFTDDFSACEKLLEEIDAELRNAIRYGAGEKKLGSYRKVYAKYSSPQKIRLKLERKELYNQIVRSYRKKNYSECAEAISLAYRNFYASLDEGVPEKDILSAMKRIEYFKDYIGNLEEKMNERENNDKDVILYDFDEILDEKYGKVGTSEREEFQKEAISYVWLYGEGPELELPSILDENYSK